MLRCRRSIGLSILAIISLLAYFFVVDPISDKDGIFIVAVANYGPHPSLEDTIEGMKTSLAEQGFIEGENVRYEVMNVAYQMNLIPQMISKMKALKPDVIVGVTTPIGQGIKQAIHNIPFVFTVITDPVVAGMLELYDKPNGNITGVSDVQNIDLLVEFASKVLPSASRVGLLYSNVELNDHALRDIFKESVKKHNGTLVAIPIDEARDTVITMRKFANKVDYIYLGSSGVVQSALPAAVAEAARMNIPVFSFDSNAVKEGVVLGSFGVNYTKVGVNTGVVVGKVLNGVNISDIPPMYFEKKDHQGYVSVANAERLGITVPHDLENATIVPRE